MSTPLEFLKAHRTPVVVVGLTIGVVALGYYLIFVAQVLTPLVGTDLVVNVELLDGARDEAYNLSSQDAAEVTGLRTALDEARADGYHTVRKPADVDAICAFLGEKFDGCAGILRYEGAYFLLGARAID